MPTGASEKLLAGLLVRLQCSRYTSSAAFPITLSTPARYGFLKPPLLLLCAARCALAAKLLAFTLPFVVFDAADWIRLAASGVIGVGADVFFRFDMFSPFSWKVTLIGNRRQNKFLARCRLPRIW